VQENPANPVRGSCGRPAASSSGPILGPSAREKDVGFARRKYEGEAYTGTRVRGRKGIGVA
jgi:hypothetical protein